MFTWRCTSMMTHLNHPAPPHKHAHYCLGPAETSTSDRLCLGQWAAAAFYLDPPHWWRFWTSRFHQTDTRTNTRETRMFRKSPKLSDIRHRRLFHFIYFDGPIIVHEFRLWIKAAVHHIVQSIQKQVFLKASNICAFPTFCVRCPNNKLLQCRARMLIKT